MSPFPPYTVFLDSTTATPSPPRSITLLTSGWVSGPRSLCGVHGRDCGPGEHALRLHPHPGSHHIPPKRGPQREDVAPVPLRDGATRFRSSIDPPWPPGLGFRVLGFGILCLMPCCVASGAVGDVPKIFLARECFQPLECADVCSKRWMGCERKTGQSVCMEGQGGAMGGGRLVAEKRGESESEWRGRDVTIRLPSRKYSRS